MTTPHLEQHDVGLWPGQWEALGKLAAETGITRPALIRRALDALIHNDANLIFIARPPSLRDDAAKEGGTR